MPYRINHIHLKASDPRKTADWYVKAFAFKIVSDETRVFGDRFVLAYTAVKEAEYETFAQVISSWEREHLLLNV